MYLFFINIKRNCYWRNNGKQTRFKIEKNIEINRVVINDDFKFFSPGLLLFNEYIKKEIPQIEGIDLTVGDEKYKFDLGGKPHIIYNLKVSI